MVLLGGDPQDVTAEQADGETPGVTFWAEPADTPRRLRVFGWQDFLPAGGAVLIGETRTGDGLRLYLYERCPASATDPPGLPALPEV